MTEQSWADQHLGVVGASEAGKCLRAITYRLAGHKPAPLPARAKWVMERGKALEATVAAMLAEEGWTMLPPPPEGYRIGDWLLAHPDYFASRGDGRLNCQIKVVNARHFSYLRRGVRENAEHYWFQVQAEMAAAGLDRTLFTACRADDMALGTEQVAFDAEAWAGRAETLKRARDLGLAGGVAERDYLYPDFHCRFCDYLEECQPQAGGPVAAGEGEAIVPDGSNPITLLKDEYLEVAMQEKALADRREELKRELEAYAAELGVRKVAFWGLTGSLTPGRASLDTAAARKFLTAEQLAAATRKGQDYWTWRATEQGRG